VLELKEMIEEALLNDNHRQMILDDLINTSARDRRTCTATGAIVEMECSRFDLSCLFPPTLVSLRPLSLSFHTLFIFLYDPDLDLGIQGVAEIYSEFEEILAASLSDEMCLAVGRAHTLHRSRTPIDLILHILQAVKYTAKKNDVDPEVTIKAQRAELCTPFASCQSSDCCLDARVFSSPFQCSWYDRGWMSPYETIQERFLRHQPGFNAFMSQFVLNYLGMSMIDFLQLDIDVAYEVCHRIIPKDQLVSWNNRSCELHSC
jgi:hypothetical protein